MMRLLLRKGEFREPWDINLGPNLTINHINRLGIQNFHPSVGVYFMEFVKTDDIEDGKIIFDHVKDFQKFANGEERRIIYLEIKIRN